MGIWFNLGGRASLMFRRNRGGQRGVSWERRGQEEVGSGQGPQGLGGHSGKLYFILKAGRSDRSRGG